MAIYWSQSYTVRYHMVFELFSKQWTVRTQVSLCDAGPGLHEPLVVAVLNELEAIHWRDTTSTKTWSWPWRFYDHDWNAVYCCHNNSCLTLSSALTDPEPYCVSARDQELRPAHWFSMISFASMHPSWLRRHCICFLPLMQMLIFPDTVRVALTPEGNNRFDAYYAKMSFDGEDPC